MADVSTILIELEVDGKKVVAELNGVKAKAVEAGEGIGKASEEGVKKAGKSASGLFDGMLGQMTKVSAQFLVIKAAAEQVVQVVSKLFSITEDAARMADEVKIVNAQFDFMAQKAGYSTETLVRAIETINRGLYDTEDILKLTTEAMGNLKIPAMDIVKNFEAARKVSVAYGVDALQAYDSINFAIATQNTRALRSLGIFIDSKAAMDSYAKSIGVASKFLTETQQQAAMFAAIQGKIGENFSNVDLNARKTSDSFKAFKVAMNDIAEALAIAWDKIAGPAVRAVLDTVAEKLNRIANDVLKSFGTEAQKASAHTTELSNKLKDHLGYLEEYKQKLEGTTGAHKAYFEGRIRSEEAIIAKTREELALIEEVNRKKESSSAFQARLDAQKQAKTEEQLAQERQLAAAKEGLMMKQIQMQQAHQDYIMQNSTDEAVVRQAYIEKQILMEQEYNIKRSQLEKEYKDAGLLNTSAYQDAEIALKQEHLDKMAKMEKQAAVGMNMLKDTANKALVSGLASSFSALGGALAKGQNGFAAFSKAAIGAVGQMAIQIGTMLVTMGLGFQSVGIVFPAWAAAGSGAVVQGLALITLGGALMAMGGGGEGAEAAGGGGGGGGGGMGATELEQPKLEDQKPKTEVVVNVEGNIFNGKDQAQVIAENLQEYFDTNAGILVRT